MKMIIDIPDAVYEMSQLVDVKYEDVIQIPLEVIKNGTPLNDVKEEMFKAYEDVTMYSCGVQVSNFASRVCKILDNIGKADMRSESCNTCRNNDDEFSGECYECIKNMQNRYEPQESSDFDTEDLAIILTALKNGTLLDPDYSKLMTISQQLAFENEELRENIEKAKAEISKKYTNTHHMYLEYALGLSYAYGIINKYIGKTDFPQAKDIEPTVENFSKMLDKIRAEIVALPKTYPFINHIDTYVKEDDVLQILDNIGKAESKE